MDQIHKLPSIGKRIIKSAVGVGLCYIVYLLRGKRGIVFYTQLALLQCMQPYVKSSLKMAAQRTTGTLIGAAYGLFVILMRYVWFPQLFENDIWYYVLVSCTIVPDLYTTVVLHRKNASYFSTVVFLSIVVAHMEDETPFIFVFNRVMDTMIGIALGMAVNSFKIPRRKREDILFVSSVDETLLNSTETISAYSKIELNRMLQEGAKFTVSTMRTPASLLEALGDISWTLPVIVMDGTALYDMKERRYLEKAPLEQGLVRNLEEFFREHELNCFVNVVIDELLVISYQKLENEGEKKMVQDLRRSPYRHFVRADLAGEGDVLYLMVLNKKERLQAVYENLREEPYFERLKVLFYDSHDYPGYAYIKVYDKDATRSNMIEVLKKHTGLKKTLTFGSIEGLYDVVIHEGDSNLVVKTLEREYEPYFWK